MKNISILGSTGSIGTQTLDVIRNSKGINVKCLSTYKNIDLLYKQIEEFKPEAVCITDEESYELFINKYKEKEVHILFGVEGLTEIASYDGVDLVLNSLMGNSGILPTIKAIEAKKNIALANKETLVSAGDLIMKKVKENNVSLLPVDSEHSAIFQCLTGNFENKIRKLYITASGGPFRTYKKEELQEVKAADALKHPNWSMGKKLTIDSSTLMNKALEVIEAKYLFDVSFEDIEVLIHPQSIIHSMVEFQDCSIIAQLGFPDMRIPISYAINYPVRNTYEFNRLDFLSFSKLSFEKPRFDDFPCFNLGILAAKTGGTMPAMVNAVNEEAVYQFLDNKIKFTNIALIIEKAMNAYTVKYDYTLSDIMDADAFGRSYINEVI